jgi:hypothetical protein
VILLFLLFHYLFYYQDHFLNIDFLEFVFNSSKFINNLQANYKNLPAYLKFAKTVDYILIDEIYNPNLCKLMLNDTLHFDNIFELRITNLIFLLNSYSLDVSLYIFKTKT